MLLHELVLQTVTTSVAMVIGIWSSHMVEFILEKSLDRFKLQMGAISLPNETKCNSCPCKPEMKNDVYRSHTW